MDENKKPDTLRAMVSQALAEARTSTALGRRLKTGDLPILPETSEETEILNYVLTVTNALQVVAERLAGEIDLMRADLNRDRPNPKS